MSKVSDTEQDALDDAYAAYRAAVADAEVARINMDTTQAKLAVAEADYEAAAVAVDEAVNAAAYAAVNAAVNAAANVYLEPQPWDCLSDTDRAAIREYVTGDRTK